MRKFVKTVIGSYPDAWRLQLSTKINKIDEKVLLSVLSPRSLYLSIMFPLSMMKNTVH